MYKIISFLAFLAVLTGFQPAFAQKKGGPKGPIPVITAPVKMQAFADQIEALGTTKSNEMTVITADTAEKVTAIHFEEGQEVKAGDLLVTLAKGEEDADLRSAQAQLAEAQSAYDRAKELQGSRAISQATLQERLATLKQRRAAIASVSARLDKRAITAPFDGVLGLRDVSVGTLVQPGNVITTIDDISVIKVDFDVPSIFLPTMQKGLSVIGKVEAFGDREFIGEVQTVNTQIDPVTRTVKVRALIPNDDRVLRPGLLMTITLRKNQRQALVIPEEALIKKGQKNFVFTIGEADEKTTAKQTEIEVGARKPGEIEVVSGLNAGDQVIAHGTVKVSDGAEISVRATEEEDTPLDSLLQQNTQAEAGEK